MKNSALRSLPLLALFAFGAAQAATAGSVTPAQITALHAGQTEAQVIAQLGKPEATPHWFDGTHSLEYRTTEADGSAAHLYVDISDKTGTVLSTPVSSDAD